jgi:hypothetical protein
MKKDCRWYQHGFFKLLLAGVPFVNVGISVAVFFGEYGTGGL